MMSYDRISMYSLRTALKLLSTLVVTDTPGFCRGGTSIVQKRVPP